MKIQVNVPTPKFIPTGGFVSKCNFLYNRSQVRFWLQIKIPAENVSMMPILSGNAKNEIFYGGTLACQL